ncbi:serine hydrolase [Rhodoblastus acidophilus]|uniref:Serine hydrolase n=1 Tax=Rhodoblastus acidophilus TaxID=1074 RepID=A0A6N8DNJ2_RHOAC|nr:D-alanyl-D-alanine carboxypeptidase family protein [Rhodoblastus acidophilus]MCW2274187.1 D-alanyl-D-alanine carboxypeptidase [Rhodoblastus acidophilus]MTV30751.1 serine hydrolase [Rhodoblastus acidophilus]
MDCKSFRNLRLILPVALVLPLAAPDAAFAARKHARGHHAAPAAPAPYVPTPYVAIDVESGRVIAQRDATRAWYPASVTKLMTVYVALQAVESGRLTLDTPMVVSARATREKPSKMGFAPGSQVTLDNALKMLMVKSANDIAVTIAEGVSGSVEAFATEMNDAARSLGMQESHFVNPNGLHDPNHYSSARDMAVLGRALLLRFPNQAGLYNIGAFRIGEQVVPTHNGLIGRYPGADGMKTGFTCPAGFNLVASATRSGRRVIVVVFGDVSARVRTAHASDLLDRAFASSAGADAITALPSAGGSPPDMRGQACGRRGKAQLAAENEDFGAPATGSEGGEAAQQKNGAAIAALPRPVFQPVDLYVGPPPGYQGPVAGPRPADSPIGAIAYTLLPTAAAASAISDHAAVAPKPPAHKAKKAAKAKPAKAHAKAHAGKAKHKTEAKAAAH